MTVNERLFQAGIMDEWAAAARRRDRDMMIRLLEQVKVSEPHFTVDTVLAHPEAYGF